MAPSDDDEALFHINDVRFGAAGKNILCVSCFSDDDCKGSRPLCNLDKFLCTTCAECVPPHDTWDCSNTTSCKFISSKTNFTTEFSEKSLPPGIPFQPISLFLKRLIIDLYSKLQLLLPHCIRHRKMRNVF